MQWFQRKSLLTNALLAAVGLLLLDRLILIPYLDWRDALVATRDEKLRDLDEARSILQREKRLRDLLAGLGASIAWDPSAAEGQLLHVMHAWEQSAGVTNASFQRISTEDEKGFTRLTFQITAIGSMGSVATLLYRVETSPIPLRVDDVDVRPGPENADGVRIFFKVITPCTGNPGAAAPPHVANAGDAEREPG